MFRLENPALQLTQVQYEKIAHCLPVQRGNVSLSNLQALNAMLYAVEHGCKWRGLPSHLGNWHTIYTRMRRSTASLPNCNAVRSHVSGLKPFRSTAPMSRCIPTGREP